MKLSRVGDIAGERVLSGDRHGVAAELEVARIDSMRAISEQPTDGSGKQRLELVVVERAEAADRLDPCTPQPLLRARADSREEPHRERRQKPRLASRRTTVMPPGLRRSDAILQTTFDVETPSEQVRLVVVRTEVWTADATARACTKPFATGARSR